MSALRVIPILLALTFELVPAATRAADVSLNVGGVARTYVLHVPPNLGSRVPLVLAFHGHGGQGLGMERLTGLDALADRDGFIVAYPDGIDRSWNDGRQVGGELYDDVGFTSALIDSLEARYPIDRARIYATGMSNGAIFSEYLGCRLADRIAAIAPVAGVLPNDDRDSCKPQRAISVLQINGTLDPVVPYGGGPVGSSGSRRSVLSVGDTIRFWADNASCKGPPKTTFAPQRKPADGTSVRIDDREDCAPGTSVVAYSVIGAGHVWPGGSQYLPPAFIGNGTDQLDATAVIVQFFLDHAIRGGK